MKRTARYQEIIKKAPSSGGSYTPSEAVSLLKAMATAKFDESIDLAVNLSLKKSQTIRDSILLPHFFGKERTVLVFARGDKARDAREAGATYVGDIDYIKKIKDGWLEFDTVIAVPDIMREIAPLGAILGRRGMMPNPKAGTVTMDVARAVQEMKGGRKEFRSDKNGVIHFSVAKSSMSDDKIIENIKAAITIVRNCRPEGHKGIFVESMYLSPTMGPALTLTTEGEDRA